MRCNEIGLYSDQCTGFPLENRLILIAMSCTGYEEVKLTIAMETTYQII